MKHRGSFCRYLYLSAIAGIFVLFSAALFAAPAQLKVVGKQLQTTGGCNFRLVGVNICGLEWQANGMGPPSGGGGDIKQSVTAAINTWKANCIRITLDQDFWFGYSDGNSQSSTTQNTTYMNNYRAIVDGAVTTASNLGAYVELDLHWSGTGSWGSTIGAKQQDMPDDHSTDFWTDVATRYKNNPAVLFNLYNEPKGTLSWALWRNGGNTSAGFHTPGHQALVNTIRNTVGANNVIVAGGIAWAWDMTGIAANALTDTGSGNGIMYEAHIYDNKGGANEAAKIALWNTNVTVAVTAGYCVMIGEFGPVTDGTQDASGCTPFESDLISWINGNNPQSYNYNAMGWCWHQGASPKLISDWSFTATGCHGTQVKNWLAAVQTPNCSGPGNTATFTPSRTRTNTPLITPTFTFTRTGTPTFTRTVTSTYTSSIVPSSTVSPSRTATATYTRTATGTFTRSASATASASPSFTYTRTPTYTFTRTNTPVNSPTNTAVNTATFTRTMTSTPINTATYTLTRTNTPVNTATNTPVNTATYTVTRTNTPGNTATNTPFNTASATAPVSPTYSYTRTPTNTPVNTVTYTITRSATASVSPTVSFTYTITRTNTTGNTATNTPFNTATNTPVNTSTYTATRTNTPANTVSATASVSPSNTNTRTPTFTATRTSTPLNTATRTSTLVSTATPTDSDTPDYSPTETWTGTPPTITVSSTASRVPSATFTLTRTATWTSTRTATPTLTVSSTESLVPSATPTTSFTASATASVSPQITFTITITLTRTTLPATLTFTPTLTLTITSNPVFTPTFTPTMAWGSVFTIENTLIYPNPYNYFAANDLYMNVTISKPASELKARIYTAAFRRVLEIPAGSGSTRDITIIIPRLKLNRLAAGTYYMVVTGVSIDREHAVSKPETLVVLR